MTSSSQKPKLTGPGHPGQQTSRASRATSNPPSVSSPAGKKDPKWEGSVSAQQAEEDSDRTLQTTEGSPSPTREETPPRDSNTSASTIKSAAVEAVRGIITKSKKGKERELHLFAHVPHLKTAQAYEETLSESLTRCHHPWNPEEDLDPLVGFGVEEGLLPGLNQVQTIPFCDMIIRWTEPHQNLDWQSLEDYTLLLCTIKLSQKDVELMPENGKSYFTLHYRILMHTYEVTLGISQIISTVDTLLA